MLVPMINHVRKTLALSNMTRITFRPDGFIQVFGVVLGSYQIQGNTATINLIDQPPVEILSA